MSQSVFYHSEKRSCLFVRCMCFMQHSCWPLSSPVPQICSWFSNLQPPRDLRGETHISSHLGCVVQSSAQEDSCFCVREKLQGKGALESCWPPLWCPWTPCFWGQTSSCSTNHLCLFPPFYFVFIIFTSSHSVWHFFLPYNLLPVFSILNPIHLCLWRGMHWFVCLDRLRQSCTSALNSDHTSITSVGKDMLNAAKIRRDSGHP